MLTQAKARLTREGKGRANFSLSYITETVNGKKTKRVDTTWHFYNEEAVEALSTLVKDLKSLGKLSKLEADSGIYLAATKHSVDQGKHSWKLLHTGSDGSSPDDRILKFSPLMESGNENIAGRMPAGTPREVVLLLLIDDGIPGYGHRYNLLNPQWTHVACKNGGTFGKMNWWIQNFGRKKNL